MQEDELFKTWVGLFMIWWKPKLDVKKSLFEPLKLVLSLVYQDLDLALKSPRTTIMKGFFSSMWSKFNLRFSKNVSKSSLFWLGDLQRDKNLQIFPPILNSKFKNSCKYLTSINFIGRKLL